MENTIVQFIIDNILLFLPLGAAGVLATAILFFLPKKDHIHTYEEVNVDIVTIGKKQWNVFALVYLFIWVMMIIIGLLSTFFIPTIVGGIIAAVPLLFFIVLEHQSKKSKVS